MVRIWVICSIGLTIPSNFGLFAGGTTGILAGWGGTRSSGTQVYSTVLREVQIPILADATCSNYVTVFSPASEVCAGNIASGGVSSCQGDSGGPLFVWSGTSYVQGGIVSHAVGCALPGEPGVYADLTDSSIRAFISNKVGFSPSSTFTWGTYILSPGLSISYQVSQGLYAAYGFEPFGEIVQIRISLEDLGGDPDLFVYTTGNGTWSSGGIFNETITLFSNTDFSPSESFLILAYGYGTTINQ